jgi:protoheme IX farnesyltransferase
VGLGHGSGPLVCLKRNRNERYSSISGRAATPIRGGVRRLCAAAEAARDVAGGVHRLVGLLVAPVSAASGRGLLPAILFIALGGGASGALNMWWDADIDAVMKRTAKRPVPRAASRRARRWPSGWRCRASVVMLGLAANWFAAGLLAFTIFFYAVVYTMWLKRSTPQNIVIGGAAGAFPPMIGWACARADQVEALLMFALIFMWTPPHFWALALFMKEDYHKAGVPMLTVTHGRKATRAHILVYTLAAGALGAGAGLDLDRRAALSGGVGGAERCWFVIGAWRIWRRDEAMAEADSYAGREGFFRFSLLYPLPAFRGLPGWKRR